MRAALSGYELGTIEPPLPVILQHARAAGICTDVLLDEELDLPAKLPAKPKHKTLTGIHLSEYEENLTTTDPTRRERGHPCPP
jgi:hypothetical protein